MNFLSKNQRYTLYKLKNLENKPNCMIENILSKTHVDKLKLKNMPEGLSEQEKSFNSNWIAIEDLENNLVKNGIFKKAKASCEYSTKQKLNSNTGELLPKEERLNKALIDVVFFQYEEEVYIITFATNFYDLKRVKNLIGPELIEPITAKHQVNSELFNWLFYKFIKSEQDITEDIYLDNINGFTGNVIDEGNCFEGKSIQTAQLIITKAFLSNGYPITSIKIDLQMNDATISFYLSEISEDNKELQIAIARGSSIDIPITAEDIDNVLPIYIFMKIIPEMVSIYKKIEEEYLARHKKSFLNEIGIEVIKTIMAKNDITLDELK